MEDILASIKRIIADDGAAVVAPNARRPVADAPPPRIAVPPAASPPPASPPPPVEILELTEPAPPLVSDDAAGASRQSLGMLSALVTGGAEQAAAPATTDTSLEGVVREMLRPMLKDWLDAHLPEIVETLVAREISRITGKEG